MPESKLQTPAITFEPTVNAGKEIAEISRDFAKPIEVLREAIHNSYDAAAKSAWIDARTETSKSGSRGLTLEVADDGHGMSEESLKNLFGLGHSEKEKLIDREPIGYKGHGTKIFYQAAEIFILTQSTGGELLLAHLPDARAEIFQQQVPKPTLLKGEEAKVFAEQKGLSLRTTHGTTIRLVDFTPNSDRLIDLFRRAPVESYVRWFTVFGSFKKVLDPSFTAPMKLFLKGTDDQEFKEIPFGHDWPTEDQIDMKSLKTKDARRPFNYFRKTFRKSNLPVQGGYRIDITAVFEGARGRLERDKGIRRQRIGGLYLEEERYGLWLCKDFIPVEAKFEWLSEEDCPLTNLFHRPLIFVNCQDFALTANRGSVGNSADALLSAIKETVFKFISEILEDIDLSNFLSEYQEDLFSRLREKDRKALQRRIERYNKKQLCSIELPDGKIHKFFEPTREITLFGVITQLDLLSPSILGLDVLDYDDHVGIDLLVRRNGNPSDLLDRAKVAYTELKYHLELSINHAFDNLHSIICWETALSEGDLVQDPTRETFVYEEAKAKKDGVTYSQLKPPADSKLSHSVKVIVLKRLLSEKWKLTHEDNPTQIRTTSSRR